MNLNLKQLLIIACASGVLTLPAQEPGSPLDLDASAARKPLDWNDPKWWEAMESKSSGIRLGKSDFVMEGPAVDMFRRRPQASGKRSLRQKFLGMPFVNPFARRTLAAPVRGEDYFAWGERETPWSTLADRPIPGPQSVLVSVSR